MKLVGGTLSQAELEQLAELLDDKPLEGLDGFFHGLAAIPGTHMPSEWLNEVLPDLSFESQKGAERLIGLVLRLHNEVLGALSDGRVRVHGDGLLEGCIAWIKGMGRAFMLGLNAIEMLADPEAQVNQDRMVFFSALILSYTLDPAELPSDDDRAKAEELRQGFRALLQDKTAEERMKTLGEIAGEIYDLLEDAREAEAEDLEETLVFNQPKPFVRSSPKIGPNQPFPCGSRKKYKKCHGASKNKVTLRL